MELEDALVWTPVGLRPGPAGANFGQVEGARHFFGRSAGIHAKGNADVLTVLKRGLPPGHFEKLRKTMGLTSSEILAVPSAIIPIEFNYLINPRHPDFSRISVGKPETFHFDKRLLR